MLNRSEQYRKEANELIATCNKSDLHQWKINPFTRALICHISAEVLWLQEAWSNSAFVDEDNADRSSQKNLINIGRAEALQDTLLQIEDLKVLEEEND